MPAVIYNEEGRAICGARTRTGALCQHEPGWGMDHPGRDRCKFHGGVIPKNPPKTGQHTQLKRLLDAIPEAMKEDVQAALNDPELLSLRQHIAVVDGLLVKLFREYGASGDLARWSDAYDVLMQANDAAAAGNNTLAGQKMSALRALLQRGRDQSGTLNEIHRVLTQRRQLNDSEIKRRLVEENMMSPQDARAFMAAFFTSLDKRVQDHAVKRAVAADLRDWIAVTRIGEARAQGYLPPAAPREDVIEAEIAEEE
jgi:hypothetical protein